jgi:hypothetical protein
VRRLQHNHAEELSFLFHLVIIIFTNDGNALIPKGPASWWERRNRKRTSNLQEARVMGFGPVETIDLRDQLSGHSKKRQTFGLSLLEQCGGREARITFGL